MIKKIESLIAPIIVAMGYELWGCEMHQSGRHSLLRIYIDAPNGVNLDDCSKVSAQVSAILDVEDLIKNSYSLEVSSPGMERQFFKFEQYKKYIGSKVRVQLLQPIDGKRKFIGVIKSAVDEKIIILVNDEMMEVAVADISKAHIIL